MFKFQPSLKLVTPFKIEFKTRHFCFKSSLSFQIIFTCSEVDMLSVKPDVSAVALQVSLVRLGVLLTLRSQVGLNKWKKDYFLFASYTIYSFLQNTSFNLFLTE